MFTSLVSNMYVCTYKDILFNIYRSDIADLLQGETNGQSFKYINI